MSTKAIKDALEALEAVPDVIPGVWAVDDTMHLAEFEPEDLEFIRACSPAAIRALLAELEEAKDLLRRIYQFPENVACKSTLISKDLAAAIGKEQSK